VYCKLAGLNLKFKTSHHFFIALQGASLFGLNYWFVYKAEMILASGLVAIVFSTLIFVNIFLGSLFLGQKTNFKVFLGALLGFTGTILIFRPEISGLELTGDKTFALLYCAAGVILASSGNILSAYNQRNKLPVLQTNAIGMTYGAVLVLLVILVSGKNFTLDTRESYYISLFYLAIFGSIIAFTTYLKLLGRMGTDKGAYATLVVPIIAITISSIFEDYNFTLLTLTGMILILSGNLLVIIKKRNLKTKQLS
jgi:drug/metabolite transporter (DMT)-like permease